jgi:hypothetical protein
VATTLPAATKFVMEPEKREQRPCLEGWDLTALDNDLGGSYKQQSMPMGLTILVKSFKECIRARSQSRKKKQ